MNPIRIGAGAGFAGDRIEPAVELAERGKLDYLVFECLAERTIALAQQEKQRDPDRGYDPLLETRMRAVLPACHDQHIKIITNAGAANPEAGAQKVAEVAKTLGLSKLRIAAITGDDVIDRIDWANGHDADTVSPLSLLQPRVISANAYLGIKPIIDALSAEADVVIAGRVADPALFLAPMVHEFGWRLDDWQLLGQGTVGGHLLECAGQLTGGYFADPGFKEAPDLARLGFPFADVYEDGSIILGKVDGSGGHITPATCKEQLIYEIHDPSRYFTPDVVADFSQVSFVEEGPNRIRVASGQGIKRPEMLKVSIGYDDGYIGEGQISYAGPGALDRAQLALDIVRERLRITGVDCNDICFELIGVDALHGTRLSASGGEPYEVRIRVAGRSDSRSEALRIGNEVESLYTNGPAGGGGVYKQVRPVIGVAATYLPRNVVQTSIEMFEV